MDYLTSSKCQLVTSQSFFVCRFSFRFRAKITSRESLRTTRMKDHTFATAPNNPPNDQDTALFRGDISRFCFSLSCCCWCVWLWCDDAGLSSSQKRRLAVETNHKGMNNYLYRAKS